MFFQNYVIIVRTKTKIFVEEILKPENAFQKNWDLYCGRKQVNVFDNMCVHVEYMCQTIHQCNHLQNIILGKTVLT